MKIIYVIVTAAVIMYACSGCATIGFRLDSEGIHFEIGSQFPEIPVIDYNRIIE